MKKLRDWTAAAVVIAALLTFLTVEVSAAASPPSPPPAPKSVRLHGKDYCDARDVARRFGLTAKWLVREKTLRLQSQWTTIDLTVDSQAITINRLRVFLSEPVASDRGTLFITRRDFETVLTPILAPQFAEIPAAVKTVVIDPGHGGVDHGNENSRLKLREKVFTLDVSHRLARLLKANGFRVVMTRTKDRHIELDDRIALARKAKADLFVSIHFNGFSQSNVAGAETFVMTPRHERSSPQEERDRTMRPTKYPGNEFDHLNAVLGYHIHREIIGRLDAADRGLKRFRYHVLRTSDCPAVLVEAAFLSNDAEGRKVNTRAYRQQIAEAVSAGVSAYAMKIQRLRSAASAPNK